MNAKQAIEQLDIYTKARLLTGSAFWYSADCREIGLAPVMFSDGPHGLRVQDKAANHLGLGTSHPSTCFPTASAMACSWDEELGRSMGERLGMEAAHMGVAMVLGPGLNVKRSPKCGRNFEYFSEDSYLSGKMAAAYVRGIQQNGTAACIKHFAVNSRERARMVYDCRVDEQTLRETYLTGFEIAVKEGKPAAVMTAYNKLNGEYCNSSSFLVRDVLRGEWGFGGLVVSDWGGTYNKVASVKAGVDLEMPHCKFSADEVVAAVKSGELDEELVNECVLRQLKFSRKARKVKDEQVDFAEHSNFARICAEQSVVLMKNEGNILPLQDGQSVAVIGDFAKKPRYQGAGSSTVNPTFLDSVLAEIKKSSLNCAGYARGYRRDGKAGKRLLRCALKLAAEADVIVVCIGLPEGMELESCDRSHIELPYNQVNLLAELSTLGKPVVAVLTCGGVVDTSWDVNCSALLHAHLPGQSGGAAVVGVLTGRVNPSGRLAETYPVREEDVPCHEIYNKFAYKMDYAEGIYVGYKYYNTFGVEVKYPFGFGLSYTTFEYSEAAVERGGMAVTVTNTGGREGATVVQMYVRAPRPELERSPAELKGFKKVKLAAGQSERVFIPFNEYTFRVWNASSHCWSSGGEYALFLGENSANFFYEGSIIVGPTPVSKQPPLSYQAYFTGRISPTQPKVKFKKGELVATPDTEIYDLKYCKGFVAKLFAFISRMYSRSDNELLANSMNHLPIRFILLFMNFNSKQVEGFIEACNGHFFKGVRKIIFKK